MKNNKQTRNSNVQAKRRVKTVQLPEHSRQSEAVAPFASAPLLGDDLKPWDKKGFFRTCKNKKGFVELHISEPHCTMSPDVAKNLARMLRDASNDPVPV